MTRIARVYKHTATNKNSLDLDPFNRKLALVGVIPLFVGAEREENLIRNDPDKSEFTIERLGPFACKRF